MIAAGVTTVRTHAGNHFIDVGIRGSSAVSVVEGPAMTSGFGLSAAAGYGRIRIVHLGLSGARAPNQSSHFWCGCPRAHWCARTPGVA
jgi:hypothetical protein